MATRSTARAIVNKALVGLGFIPIATDALYATGIIDHFGNLTSSLDKYQQQAVVFFDIFHQALSMVMNKPFMYRRFRIQTVGPDANGNTTPIYTIQQTIIEGLRPNSFFNVTNGAGPGNMLTVTTYEEYNRMWARPDMVPIGTPYILVPIPTDQINDDSCQIRLCPTPDQVYTIEGQCRFVVPTIKAGTDLCAFPYRYEHALIMKLIEVMEGRVNEGRESIVREYAEQFVAEVLRDSAGADEEIDRVDVGFRLYGRGNRISTRDYNPSTDVPGAYP